jgi:hypothetical protein
MDLKLVDITRRRIFVLLVLVQRFLCHSMYINPGSFLSQRIFLLHLYISCRFP